MMQEPDNFPKIKLIIAADQELILQSLQALLRPYADVEIHGTARDGTELLGRLERSKPDVILLDIDKPGMSAIEVVRIIDQRMPWVKVISLARHNHPIYIKEMLRHGAKGFLSKNCTPEELHESIVRVQDGKTYFCKTCSAVMLKDYSAQSGRGEISLGEITPREIEILGCLANGHTTREIAEKLFISDKTVERHKSNLLKKMQLKNTPHMVKVAVENGLLIY